MPAWTPSPQWKGTDVFIIGGGPSLAGFDWKRLHAVHTIGCNSAFLLGAAVCNLCFFSDAQWFYAMERKLESFAGRVVTHSADIPRDHPWVSVVGKRDDGLHRDALGYGGNSGCSAINLALLLGAKRVFLLGFDLKLGNAAQMNWHQHRVEPANADVFPKFLEGFQAIARDLPRVFPGCSIINLSSATALSVFPTQPVDSILP